MRNLGLMMILAGAFVGGCTSQDTDKLGTEAKTAAHDAGQTISDVALASKVDTALKLRKDIDAGTLHVAAKSGVVTITGTVKSTEERNNVEAVASKTEGVDKVIDTDLKYVSSVPPPP